MITFLANQEVAIIFQDGEIALTIHPFGDNGVQIMRLVPCAITGPHTDQEARYKDQPLIIQFSEPEPR